MRSSLLCARWNITSNASCYNYKRNTDWPSCSIIKYKSDYDHIAEYFKFLHKCEYQGEYLKYCNISNLEFITTFFIEPESPNLKSVGVDYYKNCIPGSYWNMRLVWIELNSLMLRIPYNNASYNCIDFVFQQLTNVEPKCDNLSHCLVEYRAQGTEKWLKEVCDTNSTTYTFSLPAGLVYELCVTVLNNEGYFSSSKVENIEVIGRYK